MLKIILGILFTVFYTSIKGQTLENGQGESKIAIGILASPAVSSLNGYNYIPGIAYNLGVNVKYKLNSNIEFSSGVNYFNITLKPTCTTCDKWRRKTYYLEIPFKLKINIPKEKYTFFICPALSLVIQTHTFLKIPFNDSYQKIYDYSIFNYRSGLNLSLGTGVELPLFKNTRLQVGPSFRYFLTSARNRTSINDPDIKLPGAYPYSFGIDLIFWYNLSVRR